MKGDKAKMKIKVNSDVSINDINKYLYPVKKYVQEKVDNNMYDDWNELEHTTKWIEKILKSICENRGDVLEIYYLKDDEKIIGVIFCLSGSNNLREFLQKNDIEQTDGKVAQLSCFHILKAYRGIGKKGLQDVVLKDLKEQGFEKVYIKSSHNKASSLYDKLGTIIGNYISISDNKLYKRYGNIYRIDL